MYMCLHASMRKEVLETVAQVVHRALILSGFGNWSVGMEIGQWVWRLIIGFGDWSVGLEIGKS